METIMPLYLARKFEHYFAITSSTRTQTPEMRIQRVKMASTGVAGRDCLEGSVIVLVGPMRAAFTDLVGGANLEGSVTLGLVGPVTSPQATQAAAIAIRPTHRSARE